MALIRLCLLGLTTISIVAARSPDAQHPRDVTPPQAEGSEPASNGSAVGGAELDAAERRLRASIQLNPAEPAFHAGLADVLRRQGQLQDAIASYEAAVRLAPGDVELRGQLAATLLEAKQWDRAEPHFRQATQLDSGRAELYAGLGESLRHQWLWRPAAEAFRRAAELDPANEEYRRLLQDVIRMQRRAEAAEPPSSATIWLNLVMQGIAAAVLSVAGAGLLVPVFGAVYLLVIAVPSSMLRGRSADASSPRFPRARSGNG